MITIVGSIFKQKTYILNLDNKVVIIDPGYNYEQIKLNLKGEKPDIILLTHFHFDHVACVDQLCGEFNIKAYIHQNDLIHLISDNCAEIMGFKKVTINKENVKTFIDQIEDLPSLEIIEAPGHTTGSVLFKCDKKLFTGDVLFANGDHGRVDLPGSNPLAMENTLNNIFKKLDYSLIIFPGHGLSAKLGEVMVSLKV